MSHFTQKYHRTPYASISPSLPALSQSGRTVLITGGATGIGLATAKAFLTAGAGKVIIASRSEATLAEAKALLDSHAEGSKILTLSLDLSSSASITGLWSHLKDKNIEVQTLVLNAAAFNTFSKLSDRNSAESVRQLYEVNVLGNWQMATSLLAQGPAQGKMLVNVSTVAAHWVPMTAPIYATTKAAFSHALQGMADEIAPNVAQMINVHPGALLTGPATDAGYDENTIPWDHIDLPANSIVWAASQEAAFLHGRFIWAHWDVEELKGMKNRIQEDPEFLRLGLKGVENVHPEKMWVHIREMESDEAAGR